MNVDVMNHNSSNSQFLRHIKCDDLETQSPIAGGIMFGDHPFQRVLPFTMLRLTMFFIISQSLRHFLKPLKQTDYVCNLLAGIILGPSVFGIYKDYEVMANIATHQHFLNLMGYVSLVYYLFITAVKIDTAMLLRTTSKVKAIGLSSILVPFFIMSVLSYVLHPITFKLPIHKYLFAMQISGTSFTNLAPMMEELNLLTTEVGQVALPSALVNDFVSWCVLIVVILLRSFARNFVLTILPLGLIVAFSICVLRPAMQWLIKRTPQGQQVKEVYVVVILLGAGIMASVFDVVAGFPVIGAVFFGLIIPDGPPLGSIVVERSESFIKNCLLPFFYIGIGDMTNIYKIKDPRAHLIYESIIVIGVLSKVLATMIPAMAYNMSLRKACALGFMMNTGGVMQTLFYWSFWLRQRMGIVVSSQLVISNLVVTSLVLPISLYLYKRTKKSDASIKGFELSVQAALTSSTMRILTCVDGEDEVAGILALLKATNPIESTPLCVYMVHLNELVGQAAPSLVPHTKHTRTCKHNGCVQILSALKNFSRNSNGKVATQLLTLIAPIKNMHEGICRLAQDKMIPLMIVPFRYKSLGRYKVLSGSNNLNRKIQTQAPCTVGIFIDRGFSVTQQDHNNCSVHIMVIFFGGEDDREVLTYASRMAGHPGVSITLLRIIVQAHRPKSVEERKLDESVVDSFRSWLVDDACVDFREMHVHNWLQAIQVVQSIDISCDLIMIGRRHGETTLEDKEFSALVENPELGNIGEILASTESRWCNVSILVMQHCMEFNREALQHLMHVENDIC